MNTPPPPPAVFEALDLRSPDAVADALARGTNANLNSRWRKGCTEVIDLATASPNTRLILTGDLHDNPLHLLRLVRAATGDIPSSHPPSASPHPPFHPAHLTLHELIHGDRLTNGLDFSYRVLTRVAALKAANPDAVHTLLANHELSQIVGAGVVKDGVRCVDAFNEAIDVTFAADAPRIHQAVGAFIRSMPLAARFIRPGLADILCAHSLPAPELMDRFDPTVLSRELTDDDLIPRRGSAHLMVWGRGHTPDQLTQLAAAWGVGLFILGHEKAESGLLALEPNALILNSDHEHAVYLDVGIDTPRTIAAFTAAAKPLAGAH